MYSLKLYTGFGDSSRKKHEIHSMAYTAVISCCPQKSKLKDMGPTE